MQKNQKTTTTTTTKRKRRKKNHYFTQDHEDAIIRYSNTTCVRERTDLYVRWIQPAFNEMVDKMAPRKSGDGLLAIKTDSYTLHSYETLTGYRFILVTDNAAGDLRQNLHHIYAQLWVECVVKSPIQDLSTGKKVGSPLFEHQLDAYVEHLSCF